MVAARSDLACRGGARRRTAYGPAVWGWGLACGLLLWLAGFRFLPWWAALLVWWWPSVLVGALVGLAAVALAQRLSRLLAARDGAARNSGAAGPSG